MNLQSWLLLFVILGFCSYVIYTRYISKSKGGCADCSVMKNNKAACSHCNH
ncbi:MAG: FeoB-associated Cys-rich membrane protein [Anaerococcus sp.]|nr:FeoB-associated Cys-rich membrane protein [Peptoniphilaceae bacterium]MDY3056010.1 FeoB-associated Cys-rich membrane protein [Anaerococcus sp.]